MPLPGRRTRSRPLAATPDASHASGGPATRQGRSSNTRERTRAIDRCNLRFLHQGMDPSCEGDHSRLPWRLTPATHTNPAR